MKLLYLNPNSSVHMTDGIVAVARQALPEAEILGWTNHGAPPAIQGPEDGAAAIPGLLAQLPAAREAGADAIVIACFDDVGLDQMRVASHCPVLGIGQSAFATATLLGLRYSVITTLAVSVPVIEGNIRASGYDTLCRGVRPSGLPVLTVEAGGEEVCQRLADEMRQARDHEQAQAAILGCAGMAGLKAELARRTTLQVIDGVEASARLAAALAQMAV